MATATLSPITRQTSTTVTTTKEPHSINSKHYNTVAFSERCCTKPHSIRNDTIYHNIRNTNIKSNPVFLFNFKYVTTNFYQDHRHNVKFLSFSIRSIQSAIGYISLRKEQLNRETAAQYYKLSSPLEC